MPVFGALGFMVLLTGMFFFQRNKISKEKDRSEELLLNILPKETADELKETGTSEAKQFDSVTVLFTDFKGFTQMSETLSP
jgi:adenylate cyclase